ncbi:MAG: translation elongation factor Ts [Pisciglobus halotolerans]|nr:translation elongation factor Ts [Pisciglobus halotolerans]
MAKVTAAQVKELRDMTGVGMMDAKKALVETDGDLEAAVDHLREKGMAKAAKKADRVAAEGLTGVVIDGNDAAITEVNSETDFVSKNKQFQDLIQDITKVISKNDVSTVEEAKELPLGEGTVGSEIISATTTIGEKISLRRFARFEKADDDIFGSYLHQGGRIGVLVQLEGTSDESIARDIAMHVAAINPLYVTRDEVPAEKFEHEKKVLTEQALNEGKPEKIVEKMITGRLNKWLGEISLVDQPFVKDPDQTVSDYLKANNASIKRFVRYEVGEGIEKRAENFADEVKSQMNK